MMKLINVDFVISWGYLVKFFLDSKYQWTSKSHNWFKSYSNFNDV